MASPATNANRRKRHRETAVENIPADVFTLEKSDEELREHIERANRLILRLGPKMLDKGAKLEFEVLCLEAELDRRRLLRSTRQDEVDDLRTDLEFEKFISADIVKKLNDKEAAVADLKSRLVRSEELARQLNITCDELRASLERATKQARVDAQNAFRYGVVKTLQAEPGFYDVTAEEALSRSVGGGEAGDGSSAQADAVKEGEAALDVVLQKLAEFSNAAETFKAPS